MTEPAASQNNVVDASIFGPHKLTQLLVAVATGISCTLFWIAARILHVPREPGFGPSLVQSPGGWARIVAAILLILGCWWIADRIVARRWPLAGLFAAAVGLSVWSGRSGTMQHFLFQANNAGTGPVIFLHFMLELLVLFIPIVAIWQLLWHRESRLQLSQSKTRRDSDAKGEGRSNGTAILAQIGITAAVVYVSLGETSAKKQVMVSMFMAGLAGAAVAEWFFATRDSWRWYWIAPLLVGVAGYFLAWHQAAGMEIGHLSGTFAPLSRALPLDLAGMGCAGALAGHWFNSSEMDHIDVEDVAQSNGEPRPR